MNDMDQSRADEARFVQLVAMFQMAAMQQLGKLSNPVSGEVTRDLEQAQATIGMLETIRRKSEGNRTQAESEFLDKVLFELQMNYVDETRREPEDASDDASGESGGAKPDESEDGAPEPDE